MSNKLFAVAFASALFVTQSISTNAQVNPEQLSLNQLAGITLCPARAQVRSQRVSQQARARDER